MQASSQSEQQANRSVRRGKVFAMKSPFYTRQVFLQRIVLLVKRYRAGACNSGPVGPRRDYIWCSSAFCVR
jgi:hypothetical protein